MGSSSSRTSFIEQQRIELEVEKARCEQAMQEAQVAMKQAYAEAEKAVAAMRAPWDAALSGQRQAILASAAKRTWGGALTLRALSNGNNGLWLAYMVFYLGRSLFLSAWWPSLWRLFDNNGERVARPANVTA